MLGLLYGPNAAHARDLLARYTERVLAGTWPSGGQAPTVDDQVAEDLLNQTEQAILSLQPDPREPEFKEQALTQVRSPQAREQFMRETGYSHGRELVASRSSELLTPRIVGSSSNKTALAKRRTATFISRRPVLTSVVVWAISASSLAKSVRSMFSGTAVAPQDATNIHGPLPIRNHNDMDQRQKALITINRCHNTQRASAWRTDPMALGTGQHLPCQ